MRALVSALNMEAAARAYFTQWNTHSGDAVAACFAPDGTLRDWDVSAAGAAAVGAANANIFAAVPSISIDVLSVHVSEATRTAVCEIIVNLNDGTGTTLKVVDVIEFAPGSLLIASLRAYKG